MKQALIVIDVQDSFRQRPFWDETEYPRSWRRSSA